MEDVSHPDRPRPEAADRPRLAAALRDLASRQEVDETLQTAVELASELVHGCAHADIMFLRAKGVTTPVSTDPVAVALDDIQQDTGEGPCLAAARGLDLVRADDLDSEERWPEFARRAVELGIHAVVSFQLYLHRNDGDRFGALNLYGTRPHAFDDEAIAVGEVFAAHCATTLASAIANEGSRTALESRDIIGQAKGILMERYRLSADQAFDLLKATSQERNVKLRDLAHHVAETGTMPR